MAGDGKGGGRDFIYHWRASLIWLCVDGEQTKCRRAFSILGSAKAAGYLSIYHYGKFLRLSHSSVSNK